MKKIISLIILIPILHLFLRIIPAVFKFAEFLIILDNADFGIPWWLDSLIYSIAGGLAFIGMKSLCGALYIHDRESKDMIENVISIIVGFIIAFVVHIFIKYWIVIVSIIGIIVVGLIVYFIISREKENKKNDKSKNTSLVETSQSK